MPADLRSHFFNALLNAYGFILHLAPYLLGGILLAALLNTFVPRDKPARLLRSDRWWMLPIAGVVGVVSPACTYGTVPLFMEMIKRGASMAPAATFLVASALVNPQIFLITAGALGLPVAAAQAAASLVFSILVGVLVSLAVRRGMDLQGSELKAAVLADREQHEPACDSHKGRRHHKHTMMMSMAWPRRLGVNVLDLTEFVGFYFVIGTVIAALVAEFVPAGVIIAAVGQGKWWAVPFATVVSIPTYVCGGGIIPFLASAGGMGMATGAVLAFLIAGPATRITALSALAVLFKKRAVAIYVVMLLLFATVLGIALGPFVQLPTAAGPYG